MEDELEATISVLRDGRAWLCEVIWSDGQTVTEKLEFSLTGYPDIIVTESDQALACLENTVRTQPERWRR